MFQQYLSIVRRWLWLLALTTAVTSTSAYMLVKNQPIDYEADARLIVGPGIDSPNPNLNDLRAAGQLMQTYAELATTRPVLEKVVNELNSKFSPDDLKKMIKIKTDETTQILTIKVSGKEAIQTADTANAVAKLLMRISPAGAGGAEGQIKVQLNEQITGINQDITKFEATIKDLESKLQSTTDVNERRFIADQLTQSRAQLTESRRSLTTLYDATQASYTNKIQVIEYATSADAVDPGTRLVILMAGVAGLVLALLTVLAFEYFNDTIKSSEELSRVSNMPILGAIAKHKPLRGLGRDRLVVQAMPESRAAENYRMLGSKLLLSRYKAKSSTVRTVAGNLDIPGLTSATAGKNHEQVRSVLISGTQVSDDTSEIAANLAVLLAQTGHRVILVDAYLHQPTIGNLFGITDQIGLSGVLTTQSPTFKLNAVGWAPNLSILPGGPTPPNPFELLVSARMAELIKELENQADIVIVAASPLLSFADSLILASRVDGVVVVAQSGRARRDTVKDIVDSLHSLDAHLIGAIFDHNTTGGSTQRNRKVAITASEGIQPAKNVPAPLTSAKT